jgi:oligo-1,6-glucosidase
MLSMRGTPYTYFGDELGMTNIDMPSIEEYVDVSALGDYKRAVKEGKDLGEFMKNLNFYSRENSRTPMQWNDSKNAGFTTTTPWKKVNPDYKDINVAKQDKDPNSVLNHFRKMVKLRNENKVLVYGKYELLDKNNEDIYAYTRELDGEKMLVLLNFTDQNSSIMLPQIKQLADIQINNYSSLAINNHTITLKPYQAIIVSLN